MAGRFLEKNVKFLTRRGIIVTLKTGLLEAYREQ
jgi:hypothetical protein